REQELRAESDRTAEDDCGASVRLRHRGKRREKPADRETAKLFDDRSHRSPPLGLFPTAQPGLVAEECTTAHLVYLSAPVRRKVSQSRRQGSQRCPPGVVNTRSGGRTAASRRSPATKRSRVP